MQTYRLVELLRGGDHLVELLPGILRLGEHKLLNLLKLVHPEDAPRVLSRGSGLLPEAGGVSTIVDWEVLGLHPLATVVGRDRLLRGGNQVLVSGIASDLFTLLRKSQGFRKRNEKIFKGVGTL